jgi:UDP-N-acetylglucosamine 2-epimerase (non-hydrolysing)
LCTSRPDCGRGVSPPRFRRNTTVGLRRSERRSTAPTEQARRALLNEGVPAALCPVTGNTVIDALLAMTERDPAPPDNFPQVARPFLVTAHRRENIGDGLRSAFEGLRHIADRFEDVGIFFPVHPNPGTREAAHAILGGHPRAVLTEPLSYREMVACLKRSWLVITDSGGLQEEAPTLGRPVLVLRDVTERPEAVATGVVRLVGTSAERLVNETSVLHPDEGAYRAMARPVFPYGDGRAAGRIVSAMRALVGSRGDLPALAASGQLGQRSREVGGKPARADPQQPRQSGKRHDGRGGEGDRRRSPPACTARGSR